MGQLMGMGLEFMRFFAPMSETVPDDQTCPSLFNDAEPEPELSDGNETPTGLGSAAAGDASTRPGWSA